MLDVGCGTGTLAAWLAVHAAAKVWGVDPSQEMLDVARAKVPPGVGLTDGTAERLPFKEAWFERAVMTLVVHHVDRARAFTEIRRVLAQDGRLALATFAPEQFDAHYLSPYFPSIALIDRERFGTPEQLTADLEAAGFRDVVTERLHQRTHVTRAYALERIRGRHISTFQLLSDEEYAAGVERAERELPERVDVEQFWLVLAAALPVRPGR